MAVGQARARVSGRSTVNARVLPILSDYLLKQHHIRREAEVPRCFPRAVYACFAAMNQALLVREKNRVVIDDELWLRIKEDLDRTVRGPDILFRFAISQSAYRRLGEAARFGRLEALYDPHRRTWVTTREAVEAHASNDRLAHDLGAASVQRR